MWDRIKHEIVISVKSLQRMSDHSVVGDMVVLAGTALVVLAAISAIVVSFSRLLSGRPVPLAETVAMLGFGLLILILAK